MRTRSVADPDVRASRRVKITWANWRGCRRATLEAEGHGSLCSLAEAWQGSGVAFPGLRCIADEQKGGSLPRAHLLKDVGDVVVCEGEEARGSGSRLRRGARGDGESG